MKQTFKNKVMFFIILILFTIFTLGSAYLVYSIKLLHSIENVLRLIGIIAIGIIWILLLIFSIKSLKKNTKLRYVILIILIVILSTLYIGASYVVNHMYNKLSNISASYNNYSSSLVTLSSNEVDSIEKIGDEKIGILDDENSVDGYQIPQEIIKTKKLKNELENYNDYPTMINDLLEGKIKYIFLPTNYDVMFNNIEDLDTKTKIIYSQEKSIKNSTSTNNEITKPFTMLIMGVDSKAEGIKGASFNGDALMLITFNPNTLNTTILSIPRDSYVPIACFPGQRKNKITHAAWYGESCMMKTIEGFTGIKIDYFVKINFKGVVSLVNAFKGIDVDVPIDFCEQDSNRNKQNQICLKKGEQTLNGEQALALARHRKTINDFIRGQNQQLVVKGLMAKFASISNLNQITDILDTISNNMETNMSTNEILSLYNIFKKIAGKGDSSEDLVHMQRLYISGYDKYIYDYSNIYNQGSRLSLYNFIPYQGSIDDDVKAMKINLELEEHEVIKKFSFDINKPYEETIIGKGVYNESSLRLMPSFVGISISSAKVLASQYGLTLNVQYGSGSTPGLVVSQNIPSGADVEFNSKTVTVNVVNEASSSSNSSSSSTVKPKENSTVPKEDPTTKPETPDPTPEPDNPQEPEPEIPEEPQVPGTPTPGNE